MKRCIMSFLLAFSIVFNFAACRQQVIAFAQNETQEQQGVLLDTTENDEVALAVSYGLVPEELQSNYENAVTYREFCEMLGRIVASYDEDEYVREWKKAAAKALASSKVVTREMAVLSVYEAACAMELGKHAQSGWLSVNSKMDATNWDWNLTWDYPEWPNWEEISPFEDTLQEINYQNAAIHFAEGQKTISSGKPVFEIDLNDVVGYFHGMVSRTEAITIALRFYESLVISHKADETTAAAIKAAAEVRRASILNSQTHVSFTGTDYYVSNSTGNDDNDGRSPDRPWKTLERVNNAPLLSGDAVFFRRGDLWRESNVRCREGVTYSAYGEGSKPRFYGASEDGVGLEKWTLYYDKDGMKVWKFYHDMQDVGGVIFNGGESWAERVYGWWVDGKGFMQYDDIEKPFIPEECLQKNMTCASVIDYSGLCYPIQVWGLEERKGGFFLRCDEGNPGVIFTEVEFEVSDAPTGGFTGLFEAANNCTFDNLCVMYFGEAGIRANSEEYNITVQNCEVGWGGNSIHEYIQPEPTHEYMLSGDGIYGIGNGGTVKNNYCHDVDGNGITFESSHDSAYVSFIDDCLIRGNLVERCGEGIWLHDPFGVISPKKLIIEDNIILYTGEGYVHGCWCPLIGIWIGDGGEEGLSSRAEEVRITENTVYRAVDALVTLEGKTVFENNLIYR